MNYASRVTIESTTCPGVTFCIKKMTEKRRVARELSIADLRVKVQEQSKELSELVERSTPSDLLSPDEEAIGRPIADKEAAALDNPDAPKVSSEETSIKTLLASLKAERLKNRELRAALPELKPGEVAHANTAFDNTLHSEWFPAWIKWGLYSIAGLDIDDIPATVDTLIESGPPELVTEIFGAIQDASGLSAVKEKNSPSGGPSGAPADGPTNSSTATNAAPPNGTASAIAASTSPTT